MWELHHSFMGSDGKASNSSSSSPPAASASPNAKRSRDLEDDVYVDNLHSHKRYLSEIMASSLNGLSVGDPVPENFMDYPARDDISLEYSPMSEDSDDSRYFEIYPSTSGSQLESVPSSPVSPYRCQKMVSGFVSGPPSTSYPSHGTMVSSVASSQPRQRCSDTERRFPSSPSDICHSADLRRAALLRSVQIRAQPLGSSQLESSYTPEQESENSMEAEDKPCLYTKPDVDKRGYPHEKYTPPTISERESGEKPRRILIMNSREYEPAGL